MKQPGENLSTIQAKGLETSYTLSKDGPTPRWLLHTSYAADLEEKGGTSRKLMAKLMGRPALQ